MAVTLTWREGRVFASEPKCAEDMLIHAWLKEGRLPARQQADGRAKITPAQRVEIIALRGKEAQRVTAQRYGLSILWVGQIQRSAGK